MQARNDEDQGGQAHFFFGRLVLQRAARRVHVGDIRIFMLSHMRQIQPACLQSRARYLLDARERLDFDGSEMREIDCRHPRQRRCGCGSGRRDEQSFDVSLDVILRDAGFDAGSLDLTQIRAQLAREFPHRWAGMSR